jgi:uncharacterized protein (DUF924 family)
MSEVNEQVLRYMLRPRIEDCLNLWFGKSPQIDREIGDRFGKDVVLASKGHYDHWARDIEHPRRLVALVIRLDQFSRNIYRNTARRYACDARCRDLVKRALRLGVSKLLRPIERVVLCLVLTHSEVLDDQRLCMQEWGRAMADQHQQQGLAAQGGHQLPGSLVVATGQLQVQCARHRAGDLMAVRQGREIDPDAAFGPAR